MIIVEEDKAPFRRAISELSSNEPLGMNNTFTRIRCLVEREGHRVVQVEVLALLKTVFQKGPRGINMVIALGHPCMGSREKLSWRDGVSGYDSPSLLPLLGHLIDEAEAVGKTTDPQERMFHDPLTASLGCAHDRIRWDIDSCCRYEPLSDYSS